MIMFLYHYNLYSNRKKNASHNVRTEHVSHNVGHVSIGVRARGVSVHNLIYGMILLSLLLDLVH